MALTLEDIERYDLPPAMAKRTDTRTPGFVAKYGDISVELDALPPPVLGERLETAVCERLDMGAICDVWQQEKLERQELRNMLRGA